MPINEMVEYVVGCKFELVGGYWGNTTAQKMRRGLLDRASSIAVARCCETVNTVNWMGWIANTIRWTFCLSYCILIQVGSMTAYCVFVHFSAIKLLPQDNCRGEYFVLCCPSGLPNRAAFNTELQQRPQSRREVNISSHLSKVQVFIAFRLCHYFYL